MKPTSSTKRSAVISLLQQGYSLHQIESKTGLGKSIIGRIGNPDFKYCHGKIPYLEGSLSAPSKIGHVHTHMMCVTLPNIGTISLNDRFTSKGHFA